MFREKLTLKKIIAILGLFGGLVWLAVFSFPDEKLHLVFCDVGQGDAILVSKGLDQILIDGGPNDKVLQCLSQNMPLFDRTVEMVVLTHPEADHLTGLIPVMDKYKVQMFLAGPEGNTTAAYASLTEKLQSFCRVSPCEPPRGRLANPYAGEKIKLGEITMETLWPEREWVISKLSNYPIANYKSSQEGAVLGATTNHAKLNDFSLVFLLKYKNLAVLLMGDADAKIQDEIMTASPLEEVDILKFPHHGSKTGIREDFLQKISPKEAVISVGKNSYGHPSKEALDLLEKYGVTVKRTDLEGDIKMVLDEKRGF